MNSWQSGILMILIMFTHSCSPFNFAEKKNNESSNRIPSQITPPPETSNLSQKKKEIPEESLVEYVARFIRYAMKNEVIKAQVLKSIFCQPPLLKKKGSSLPVPIKTDSACHFVFDTPEKMAPTRKQR